MKQFLLSILVTASIIVFSNQLYAYCTPCPCDPTASGGCGGCGDTDLDFCCFGLSYAVESGGGGGGSSCPYDGYVYWVTDIGWAKGTEGCKATCGC